MGYEVRLHIGTTSSFTDLEYDMTHGRSMLGVVQVDLSKPGNDECGKLLSAALKAQKKNLADNPDTEPKRGFYASDGDTLITEDAYGDPVSPVDVDALIRALEADLDTTDYGGKGYRRFELALSILKVMKDRWPNETLTVLTYGH